MRIWGWNLIGTPKSDEAFIWAKSQVECRPDENQVADQRRPGFGFALSPFEFKASAGDAQVQRQRPSQSDDERNEHSENCQGAFFGKRGHDQSESKPKFKLRIQQTKKIVDEIRQELVLGNENGELFGILNFKNARKNEHAADADAEKRFQTFDGEVSVYPVGGENEQNG